MNSSRNIKIVIRIIAVLILGIMMSIALHANMDKRSKLINFANNKVEEKLENVAIKDIKSFNALSPIGFELTPNQSFLIHITYPELKEYAKSLKSNIGKLKEEIEEKKAQYADLDKKLLYQERQYYQLLEDKVRLAEQIKKHEYSNKLEKETTLQNY